MGKEHFSSENKCGDFNKIRKYGQGGLNFMVTWVTM